MFHKVCSISDVPLGSIREFVIDGKSVAIANVDGKFFCINSRCTHRQGPLGEGELNGSVVTCPWHGAQFDITNGKVLGPPATQPVSCFKVKIEGEHILVDL